VLGWLQQEIGRSSTGRIEKPITDHEHEAYKSWSSSEILLKVDEVAEILNLVHSKVYQMMQQGLLPSVRFGRSVRVRPVDLEAFVEQNKKG
jgi:excisionase family DNA binding protein